jgi:hypothetical protein
MRLKNPAPTPAETIRALKAVSIVQHSRPSRHGSYDEDEQSQWLTKLANLKAISDQNLGSDGDIDIITDVDDVVSKDFAELGDIIGSSHWLSVVLVHQYKVIL